MVLRLASAAMAEARERWVGLESNPEVMTRYAHKLGPAEAVPYFLRIGYVEEARRVAIHHKEKLPELLRLVVQHSERGT